MPGRYRLRDLATLPGVLTLARIPLAAVFPFVVDRPLTAFAVLLAAGLTDVLDGWAARRFRLVTPTGVALDGVTDKLFALTVGVTLVVEALAPQHWVLLLFTRELVELPLVVWFAVSRRARLFRAAQPASNVFGKAATVLQFAAVTAILFRSPHAGLAIAATAAVGAWAAVTYWVRAVRQARSSLR